MSERASTVVVGGHSEWNRWEQRWVWVQEISTTRSLQSVPVTVTATWFEEYGSYGYIAADGCFHSVAR